MEPLYIAQEVLRGNPRNLNYDYFPPAPEAEAMDIDQVDQVTVQPEKQSLAADTHLQQIRRDAEASKRWYLYGDQELGNLARHDLQDLLDRERLIAGARSLDFEGGPAHIGNRPYPKGDVDIKHEGYPNVDECQSILLCLC